MKLFYGQTSPFARKVLVLARELGLQGRVETIEINPWKDEGLRAANPMNQVPTLVLEGGEAIYDSSVICDYLDELAGRLAIPAEGPERWRALRLQATADGVCAAVVRRVREALRGEDDRHADVVARQTAATAAGLDVLEGADLGDPSAPILGVGQIAVAVTCGYLDLRAADDEWRKGRPRLEAWYAAVKERPSLVATEPPTKPPG